MIIKKRKHLDFDFEGLIILLAIANICGIAGSEDLSTIEKIFLLALCVVMAWAIISAIKYSIQKKKASKVTWADEYLNFDYINKINFKAIGKEYLFDKEREEPYINEILSQVKTQMRKQFFRGTLPWQHELRKLSDEEYVILYLHSYLGNFRLRDEISGLAPIKYSHKEGEYTTVYTLTESGFVFYKLLYAIDVYCENNTKILQTGFCSINNFNYKKVLDSGTYISCD